MYSGGFLRFLKALSARAPIPTKLLENFSFVNMQLILPSQLVKTQFSVFRLSTRLCESHKFVVQLYFNFLKTLWGSKYSNRTVNYPNYSNKTVIAKSVLKDPGYAPAHICRSDESWCLVFLAYVYCLLGYHAVRQHRFPFCKTKPRAQLFKWSVWVIG